MICISYIGVNTFEEISYQLRYYRPKIYYYNNYNIKSTSNFSLLINKKYFSGHNAAQIQTRFNQYTFTHFAKSYQWANDLYESFVSPYFQSAFLWETWRRSPEEPSFCYPNFTWTNINVLEVQFDNNASLSFDYTQDHSKLGISSPNNTYSTSLSQMEAPKEKENVLSASTFQKYVCVGDMNRMYSQETRGGGTACIIQPYLWQALKNAFIQCDTCSS